MELENEEKKEILRKILEPEARERLGRIKLVKPDLVNQIENYFISLYSSGKIKKKVSEEELIEILKKLVR